MDHYSILDPGLPQKQSGLSNPAQIGLARGVRQDLPKVDALQLRPEVQGREESAIARARIPREENAGSFTDIAASDLDAVLQLLAERAEYITRATGAAIALWEGEEMVCRASSGASAPAVGARLQVDAGLSGESVRTLQVLRCDDAETDKRVNRESCRALGIASVVVLPLVREQRVRGLFELFSDQAYAFAARDLEALERLGEMVDTALEHADAAQAKPGVLEAVPISARKPSVTAESAKATAVTSSSPTPGIELVTKDSKDGQPGAAQNEIHLTGSAAPNQLTNASANTGRLTSQIPYVGALKSQAIATRQPRSTGNPELANIRKCETCGFPVSEGRKLCLDCEARSGQRPGQTETAKGAAAVSAGQAKNRKQPWIVENKYMLSALVLFVMVLIAMLLSHSS